MESRPGRSVSSCTLSPLTGRVYYLDVKPSKIQAQLKAKLCKMGANVEEFFSKDVNFLITDRQEVTTSSRNNNNNDYTKNCADVDSWLPDTPVSGTPSPAFSRVFSLDNDTQFPESPVTDSFRAPIPAPLQSRGQALLERSKHKVQKNGSADVLEISRQWGIKILSLRPFLEHLDNWLKKCAVNNSIKQKSEQKKNGAKPFQIIQMTSPFIKVQDSNEEYRPFYRLLENWPDLNLDSASTGPPQLSCYGKGQSATLSKKRLFVKSSPRKNQENLPGLAANVKTACRGNKNLQAQKAQQKSKLGHCEICAMSYSNLSKHVQTKAHASFMLEDKNFVNLQKMVLNLPTTKMLMMKKKPLTDVTNNKDQKYSTTPSPLPQIVKLCKEEHVSIQSNDDEDGFVEASCSTRDSSNPMLLEGLPLNNHSESTSSEIHMLHQSKSLGNRLYGCPDANMYLTTPDLGPPPIAHQASVPSSNCTNCTDEHEPLNLSLRQSPDPVKTEKFVEPHSAIQAHSKRRSEHLFFSENAQVSTLEHKDGGSNLTANPTVCFSKEQFESHKKPKLDRNSDFSSENTHMELSPKEHKEPGGTAPAKSGLVADRQVPDVQSVRKVLSFASSPRKPFRVRNNSVMSSSLSSWQNEALSGLSPVESFQVCPEEKNSTAFETCKLEKDTTSCDADKYEENIPISEPSTCLYTHNIFNSDEDSTDFSGFKTDFYS